MVMLGGNDNDNNIHRGPFFFCVEGGGRRICVCMYVCMYLCNVINVINVYAGRRVDGWVNR